MKQWELFESFKNRFKSKELNYNKDNFAISQDENFSSISR